MFSEKDCQNETRRQKRQSPAGCTCIPHVSARLNGTPDEYLRTDWETRGDCPMHGGYIRRGRNSVER